MDIDQTASSAPGTASAAQNCTAPDVATVMGCPPIDETQMMIEGTTISTVPGNTAIDNNHLAIILHQCAIRAGPRA